MDVNASLDSFNDEIEEPIVEQHAIEDPIVPGIVTFTKDLDDTILTQIEQPIKEKKKKHIFGLSLTNTFSPYSLNSKVPHINAPMEDGGWSCKKCGKSIKFDDCLGISESSYFKVIGYYCHHCEHRWLRPEYQEEEDRSGQNFMSKSRWELKKTKINVVQQ
jgi:hypothetical protein